MQPQRLIGRPMDTDDHCRGYVSCLNGFAPLRDQLTVPSEYDRLGRSRRDIHRDLPTTVVLNESLGDELTRDRRQGRSSPFIRHRTRDIDPIPNGSPASWPLSPWQTTTSIDPFHRTCRFPRDLPARLPGCRRAVHLPRQAQPTVDTWVGTHNADRPHQALDEKVPVTPAERLAPVPAGQRDLIGLWLPGGLGKRKLPRARRTPPRCSPSGYSPSSGKRQRRRLDEHVARGASNTGMIMTVGRRSPSAAYTKHQTLPCWSPRPPSPSSSATETPGSSAGQPPIRA